MKRKVKLFCTLLSVCFSIFVLCFGVYAATSVSYTLGGSVVYVVNDVFVDVTTKVYASNAIAQTNEKILNYSNNFVNQIPNTLEDGKYNVVEVSKYNDVFDYNSLIDELEEGNVFNASKTNSLDLTFDSNAYSYFVVVNIKNLADNVVYTKISQKTESIDGMALCATDSYLRIFKDETDGQSIVFGYSIADFTKSINNESFSFSLEFSCLAPYTYGEFNVREGALLSEQTELSNRLRSFTFTNNKADFEISNASMTIDVGDYYGEDSTKKGDVVAYLIENNNLYDCFVYAPVSLIYAPENCFGFFSHYVYYSTNSIEADSYNVYWEQNNLRYINLKSFDTSKSRDFSAMFGGLVNLEYIYALNHINTVNVGNFAGMFYGCDSLKELDLSSFTFNSNIQDLSLLGMIGFNDAYLEETLGNYASAIINAQNLEQKIYNLAYLIHNSGIQSGGGARCAADNVFFTHINKIIAPKNIGNLKIGLPYSYSRATNELLVDKYYKDGDSLQTACYILESGCTYVVVDK